jgi:hypothetical protein
LTKRSVVVFAKPRGGVAVLLEYLANCRVLRADHGVIAWVASGQFAHHAKAHRVMVAAGDECRRVGEQRAVEWNWMYRSPALAIRSSAGVGMTPPKVPGTL